MAALFPLHALCTSQATCCPGWRLVRQADIHAGPLPLFCSLTLPMMQSLAQQASPSKWSKWSKAHQAARLAVPGQQRTKQPD
eukprot:365557-Chlamydomonas_euryale.AAC.4